MTARTRTVVCPPDHAHAANHNCYTAHRCACDDCLVAYSAYKARKAKLVAYGRWNPRVPIETVREHMLYLRECGLGYKGVAHASGVSARTLPGIMTNPDQRFVSYRNASAILAVKPSLEAMAPGAVIPARGVQRRLRALVAAGWTQSAIAAELGHRVQAVGALIWTAQQVMVKTHRSVAEVFERLSGMPAPREGTARRGFEYSVALGRRERWAPPLAWDDIDNDPRPVRVERVSRLEFVDELVVELTCNGHRPRRLSHAELRLVIRVLHSRQFGDPLIAERAGISDREVVRIRKHELGLPAVAYGVSVHRRVA